MAHDAARPTAVGSGLPTNERDGLNLECLKQLLMTCGCCEEVLNGRNEQPSAVILDSRTKNPRLRAVEEQDMTEANETRV